MILDVWGQEQGARSSIAGASFRPSWSARSSSTCTATAGGCRHRPRTENAQPGSGRDAGRTRPRTQLRVHLVGALRNGATEREIVETILQVGLLAGFPTSWDALAVCKEVFAEEREKADERR